MAMPNTNSLIDLLVSIRSPDKELGQHYLHDDSVLEKAVELGGVSKGDVVLEIGSGPGTLTAHILKTGAAVHAIEIDPESCSHLEHVFQTEINEGKLTLTHGDVLEVELPSQFTHVIANIPYQISSPLIEKLLNRHRSGRQIETIVLLLQDEFASRLAMLDGPASHGPLGITTAFEWEVYADQIVHSHSFKPAPKVNSRLVKMVPRENPHELPSNIQMPSLKLARMVVRECFQERRKKMRNRLTQIPKRIARAKGWYAKSYRAAAKSVIRQEDLCGLPTGWAEARPEQFGVVDWLILVSHLEAQKEG